MKQLFDSKDKRFKIAHKEAVIGVILVIINFLLWFGFAYGMGSGDPTAIQLYSWYAGMVFL